MMNFAKRLGIPFLAALAVWDCAAVGARAQFAVNLANQNMALQQAAMNMALTGRFNGMRGNFFQGARNAAFLQNAQGYSPYSYGLGTTYFNPVASALYANSVYANSLNNPYLSALTNPYASLYSASSPYGGLSAMTSYGGLPSSVGSGYGGGYGGGGYYPYSYATQDPYGGFLRGSADVINAQGKFLSQVQQAKLYKEQAEQAKIETRRKLFDEIMYERANTPSFTERREKLAALELRRSQKTASINEIWSGRALNILLKDLKQLYRKQSGPDIDLSKDILKQINVVGAKGKGNIGLLRNDGQLTWPLGLRDLEPVDESREIRRNLDRWAQRAVKQAANGEVDAGLIKDMRANVQKLHRLLARNVNDLPTSQYIEAKRFLNNFDDAVKSLESSDVANYFNQTWMAKGKTVKDLVSYMDEKGLSFAPAVSGDEAAYQALYSALAAYDISLHQNDVVSRDKKTERE
jgi:hypothetical protein